MKSSNEEESGSQISSRYFWLFVVVVGTLSLARLMGSGYMLSSNDRSRWCTIRSLVEERTYIIDRVVMQGRWDTIDKVRHEGHFYSSKIALFPTVIAGFDYLLVKATGWDFDHEMWQIHVVTLLVVNIIPFLISLWCFKELLSRSGTSLTAQWVMLTLYGLGTAVSPYLCALNNHAPATCSVIITLWGMNLLMSQPRWLYFVVTGFFAAWTCTLELPAALLGVWSFVVSMYASRIRTLLAYIPSALIPLASHFYLNYLVTGGLKPFYAYYGTEKYVYEFWGIPSYWSEPQGIDKALDPLGTYLFHCTLGHHGIFSLTPLLLLAIVFWLGCWAFRKYPLWNMSVIGGISSAIVLGFYLTRTENYNYSGSTVSLRWMMWTIPFFMLAALPVVNVLSRNITGLVVVNVLLAGSIFSAWFPLTNPWSQPWIFQLLEAKGLIDYRVKPTAYEFPHRMIISQLAETEKADTDYWVELGYTNSHNVIKTFKIQDDGPVEEEGKQWRRVLLTGNLPGMEMESAIPVLVAVKAFQQEETGVDYLKFPGSTTEKQARLIRELFQGLPGVSLEQTGIYEAGMKEFLFLPVQKNAIRSQKGSLGVTREFEDQAIPNPGYKTYRRYSSEVWNSEELPFGIARWQFTIVNTIDPADASKLTVTAVRAGKLFPRKGSVKN